MTWPRLWLPQAGKEQVFSLGQPSVQLQHSVLCSEGENGSNDHWESPPIVQNLALGARFQDDGALGLPDGLLFE